VKHPTLDMYDERNGYRTPSVCRVLRKSDSLTGVDRAGP
jgi:hypothetical protein